MASNVSKLPQAKIDPGVEIGVQPDNSNTAEPKAAELNTVVIELPLLPIEGYVRKRVDVTFTSAEAHALKSVRNALESRSVQLANGKNVTTVSVAVRWIIQQIMV